MSYYNYHGVAMKLIQTNHCLKAEFVTSHNDISPALILYFDNHRPMPIRQSRFGQYVTLLNYFEVSIYNQSIIDKK